MTETTTIPESQFAVQLIGPGQLRINESKAVMKPGPKQMLLKIEAVGLCFSDTKLLKQFSGHPRKAEIVAGLDASVLKEIESYVPGDKPVVPGHEVVAEIVAIGSEVKHHKLGERVLVQTDYRDLKTAGSNAAFGYNFEGGLQEYVLIDERVAIDPRGERFLIPAPAGFGASSIALVEPWACVESSYITEERQTIRAGGRLLVVAEPGRAIKGLAESFSPEGDPVFLNYFTKDEDHLEYLTSLGITMAPAEDLTALVNEGFDDIVYYGSSKSVLEILNDKLATRAIMNVVLGGERISLPVSVGVGRVHYGMTRWIGTAGDDASDSYKNIPATGELRAGDRIQVVGAGGPMGQMHVIRAAASGLKGLEIVSTDMDDPRLAALKDKVSAKAEANKVKLSFVNPKNPESAKTSAKSNKKFTYIALMAPVGALVAQAIADSAEGCLINIFAGIPAPVKQDLDLDQYIANRCFMFGTSGSEIRDMHIVLGKVKDGRLETDLSVDAVSGMAGALAGLAAVENRTLAGKIIVYPMLHNLPLTPLNTLAEKFPTVAAKLERGNWTKEAEAELLRVAAN